MALADWKLVHDFGDALGEAASCRTDGALFDFSFLECARIEGPHAQSVIETFTGRSLAGLPQREIVYALRAQPSGDLAADLTIWKTGPATFEIMSGRREDIVDLLGHAGAKLQIADIGEQRAVFAVQGPRALEALGSFGDIKPIQTLKYFAFDNAELVGIPCIVGRLGYTGEAGFEIIVERRNGPHLWQTLASRVKPAGFVAADMLRIEAGFVLFCNEFQLPVWPREAGLAKFATTVDPPPREISLVSFRADAEHLPLPWRPPVDLRRPTTPGTIAVTSACNSLVAGSVLGLGYVLAETASDAVLQDPTGTFRNIQLTAKPFYDTAKRRPRLIWREHLQSPS